MYKNSRALKIYYHIGTYYVKLNGIERENDRIKSWKILKNKKINKKEKSFSVPHLIFSILVGYRLSRNVYIVLNEVKKKREKKYKFSILYIYFCSVSLISFYWLVFTLLLYYNWAEK